MNINHILWHCRNFLPLVQVVYYIMIIGGILLAVVAPILGILPSLFVVETPNVNITVRTDNFSYADTSFIITCPGAYLPENITEAISKGICTYHRDTTVGINQKINVSMNVDAEKIPANISS